VLYLWRPGLGPDGAALARLQAHGGRPNSPMGEAWFMSERRKTFDHLLEQEVADIDSLQLAAPLEEMASGVSCFGPMREWSVWFHYLLPRLVPVSLDRPLQNLQELLVTALMTQYPQDTESSPYKQFREDVLNTLGLCIMDGRRWSGGRIVLGHVLHETQRVDGTWGWYEASGDLSSSLFLCAKYLDPSELGPWLESVVAIEDPHWRAQFLVWLMGARRLMRGPGLQPADVFMMEPRVDWASSHVLDGHYTGNHTEPIVRLPFISDVNKVAFWAALSRLLTAPVVEEWFRSVRAIDYLDFETAHVIESPAAVLKVVRGD
jgi:hypothetical protein